MLTGARYGPDDIADGHDPELAATLFATLTTIPGAAVEMGSGSTVTGPRQ